MVITRQTSWESHPKLEAPVVSHSCQLSYQGPVSTSWDNSSPNIAHWQVAPPVQPPSRWISGYCLGLGRVWQGAKMLITPVACGCLIKQRRQPILAGNCRIGLRNWGGETIPLWNCAVDEGVFEIVSSGWKFPHLVLVLGSGARVTLQHPKVFRVHSYVLMDDLIHVGQPDVLQPFL